MNTHDPLFWLVVITAIIALSFILIAGAIIYVQTDKGEFIITTSDADIAVMVNRQGVKINDVKTGRETIVNGNLGAIPQANQPIRGFSRLRKDGFLTSIAHVRSDIWLLEGFGKAPGYLSRLGLLPK